MTGSIMVDFDEAGFTVEPMAPQAACTPHSVSAHMLYENSDPFHLFEPGGHLDVTAARYTALDGRRVRVEGSEWVPGPYTVKLEGARAAGYQTTILAVLRDPHYVAHARDWVAGLTAFLHGEISRRMGLAATDYTLEFRLIGVDAALGAMESRQGQPAEVGVLGIVTADTPGTGLGDRQADQPLRAAPPADARRGTADLCLSLFPCHHRPRRAV